MSDRRIALFFVIKGYPKEGINRKLYSVHGSLPYWIHAKSLLMFLVITCSPMFYFHSLPASMKANALPYLMCIATLMMPELLITVNGFALCVLICFFDS